MFRLAFIPQITLRNSSADQISTLQWRAFMYASKVIFLVYVHPIYYAKIMHVFKL